MQDVQFVPKSSEQTAIDVTRRKMSIKCTQDSDVNRFLSFFLVQRMIMIKSINDKNYEI